MEIAIQITDKRLYNALVESVELGDLKAENRELFTGHIRIYKKTGGLQSFYGLVEANDFEKDFGFVLCVSEEELTGIPKTVESR